MKAVDIGAHVGPERRRVPNLAGEPYARCLKPR